MPGPCPNIVLHGFAVIHDQGVHSNACACASKQLKDAASKRASEGVRERSEAGSDVASGQASEWVREESEGGSDVASGQASERVRERSEGGSDVASGQARNSRNGAKHEYWGKHHLGGALVLALNTGLRNAALTHNGPAGNRSRGEDGARATQEGGRAGLNGGRGVAGLDHRVDDVGGGTAAVGGDHCLQSWQLMRMQYEVAVV